jgi:hypothetical protein
VEASRDVVEDTSKMVKSGKVVSIPTKAVLDMPTKPVKRAPASSTVTEVSPPPLPALNNLLGVGDQHFRR